MVADVAAILKTQLQTFFPASCSLNHHSVSNLPFLDKLIEKALQISFRFSWNFLLRSLPVWLQPGYGTETALVALTDDLWGHLDRSESTLQFLLDLSAAFDIQLFIPIYPGPRIMMGSAIIMGSAGSNDMHE